MRPRWQISEHSRWALFIGRWLMFCVPLGVIVGSVVAFFLWSLDRVTELQWNFPWLLFLLPLAGLVSGLMYHYFGKNSEAGNSLILAQIQEPSEGVPTRMAPLVLAGTLITHLFGGSAGREGTAVQMGGSLASAWGRWLRLNVDETRWLLMAGVAAGFGAVFGTPLAGAIFAVEVMLGGRPRYAALLPCLIAAFVADQITIAWGIGHTAYAMDCLADPTLFSLMHTGYWLVAAKVLIAGILFGFASRLFVQLTHVVQWTFKNWITIAWLRPAVGGCVVIALVGLLGERDYLGLGVDASPHCAEAVTIQSSFHVDGANRFSWWWKSLFTAVTVGSGFKGGEVTPLFFIGATLGNTAGILLAVPVDLMAALGFVAVFAGAAKTPLACTLMAIELFAPHSPLALPPGLVAYLAAACYVARYVSGRSSIYLRPSHTVLPQVPAG